MLDVKLDIAKGKSKKSVLRLKGRLTVEHAQEIKEALLKALKANKNLEIKLEDISDIDLSCLQLFSSAYQSLQAKRKNITLAGSVPDIFNGVVAELGYCSESRADCFWTGNKVDLS